MTLIRSDRIWLAKVMLFGCLILTLLNAAILGFRYWAHRAGDEKTDELATVETEPEDMVNSKKESESVLKPELRLWVRYPVFRGKDFSRGFHRGGSSGI